MSERDPEYTFGGEWIAMCKSAQGSGADRRSTPLIYRLLKELNFAGLSNAPKTMIAFADPVFSNEAQTRTRLTEMRSITSFYQGSQIDIRKLAAALPQLQGTRREVESISRTLGVNSMISSLGLR